MFPKGRSNIREIHLGINKGASHRQSFSKVIDRTAFLSFFAPLTTIGFIKGVIKAGARVRLALAASAVARITRRRFNPGPRSRNIDSEIIRLVEFVFTKHEVRCVRDVLENALLFDYDWRFAFCV